MLLGFGYLLGSNVSPLGDLDGIDGTRCLVTLGVGLYRHRNAARVSTIVFAALGTAGGVLAAVDAVLSPAEQNLTGHTVESIGLIKTLIIHAFWIAVYLLLGYFLNTEKAESEFGVLR